jgi:hypothetical protein
LLDTSLRVLHTFAPMDASATPNPADTLPRAACYQAAHSLRALLPPPAVDTPEDAAQRDSDAINHVASLRPATPDEASLAAYYVAAGAQAAECIRLARAHPDDVAHVLKCTAQSASMMRQALRWRTTLLRAQADRQRREAHPHTDDSARPAEQPAFSRLTQPPDCPPSSPRPELPMAPKPEHIAQAEHFAQVHRNDAILLRRGRHIPNGRHADLPLEVIHALIAGTTPILCSLDKKWHQPAARAA